MALFPRYLTGGLQRAYKRGAESIRSAPIATRVLGAIGVLAVLVAIAFAVVLLAMSNLRSSTDEQVQANRVTAATLRLGRVVDELEGSLRSFVLTRNDRIRQTWNQAEGKLPRATADLSNLVVSQPAQKRLASSTIGHIRDYVTDYGNPLIAIALVSPAAALSPAASQDGLTRIGEIRRGLATLLAREDQLASARAANASSEANRAVLVGVAALAASGVLLVLVMGYLVRSVAHPVRDVATGAARIASGDFSIRIPQEGPAEIQELTGAFNSMAASVESGRRDLQRQNEQLRHSERAKSELITIVAHELRTPLASILGYTSLILRRDTDAASLRRYVEIIHDQGRRLDGLVDEFLSADEGGGRLELDLKPLDLARLLKHEVELARTNAPDHEIVVTVPEEGLLVRGDRDRLVQVTTNLLANAIKYSPEGGRVFVLGEREAGIIRVLVRDEGLGIPEEHQPRVFSKFFRGEAKASGIPGVGLGLAVSREIVEAHGGRIDFTSEVEAGSTFWFELPALGGD
jgi:signal transduction histidine kinase